MLKDWRGGVLAMAAASLVGLLVGMAAFGLPARAQVQSAPVSTSNLCFDPVYPRLVLASGTGPRNLVLPEGVSSGYQQDIAVLPAESTWLATSQTPWIKVTQSVPQQGVGHIPVMISPSLTPTPMPVGHYEGAVTVTITGLYQDVQGHNVSTVIALPVSLDIIPGAGSPPPPAPAGLPVQVDAPHGSSALVIMRRTPGPDVQVLVNPGTKVLVSGAECVATPGLSRRCPVL